MTMKLREIVAIAGKPGLYRVFKPTRTGMIVETLDAKRTKLIVSASERISVLQEIGIYTTNAQESEPLPEVFQRIKAKYGFEIKVGDQPAELFGFLEEVLPEYDRSRVYPSDVRKLAAWYKLIVQFAPEALEPQPIEEETTAEQAE